MLIFYDKEKKLLLNFMNNLKDINLKNLKFEIWSFIRLVRVSGVKKNLLISILSFLFLFKV